TVISAARPGITIFSPTLRLRTNIQVPPLCRHPAPRDAIQKSRRKCRRSLLLLRELPRGVGRRGRVQAPLDLRAVLPAQNPPDDGEPDGRRREQRLTVRLFHEPPPQFVETVKIHGEHLSILSAWCPS